MAKNKNQKLTSKKKTQKLFVNMFAPLLTMALVICTVFALLCGQIIRYYVKAELSRQVEKLSADTMTRLYPAIVNVEDFANLAATTQDPEIMTALVQILSQNLNYARAIYYATETSRFNGGIFIDSSGWVPPANFEPSSRDWFKNAVKNGGGYNYEEPYLDAATGKLSLTISKAVKDGNGKIVGVVAVDIFLDELVDLMNSVELSEHGRIFIITQDGKYMTNPDASKIMTANYFEDLGLDVDLSSAAGTGVQTIIEGKNYYVGGPIGFTPWYIIIDGLIKDYVRTIYYITYLIEAIAAVFAIISSLSDLRLIIKMRKDEQELGAKLFEETQTLVVAAKENAATSQDQSAAVKEIVATMEDSNALSESISSKIRDVSKVAEKTSSDVADGVASIEQNVAQLHAIFDANQQTIDGMKVLSERIESIWDIVTLINNVADQAKIIAFNAELEASSAGEAGKSFRIVANEIRRLSDGIIDGTKEIKERITEIQHSSDSLILASESGTEKINEGYENAKSLGEKFASIKNSAEVTAGSAGDITDIIQQQTNASEQILIALKQISAGVENFTVATDNISASSEHIRAMSEAMNSSMKTSEDEKKK